MFGRWRQLDPLVLALAGVVAAAGVALHTTLGPPDTYWTIDNGGKALALQSLQSGRWDLAYPGTSVDPGFAHFPMPLEGAERYATVVDGRVIPQYQSPFVALTLPFARAFGFAGLAILPGLGAGAVVLLAGALAFRRTGSRAAARVAAATLTLGTPLLFYGSTFWEHTLTAALAAGALLVLDAPPRRPLMAGLLLGAAAMLREELLLLLVAAAIVLLVRRCGRTAVMRLLAGAVPGLVLLAAFQRLATGSWSGVHLEVNRAIPFAATLDAVRGLLLDPGLAPGSLLLPGAALALLVAARFSPVRRADPLRGIGALVLAVLGVLAFRAFPGGMDAALALAGSNSAVVFVPWVFLAATAGRGADGQRGPNDPPASRPLADRVALLFVLLFLVLVPARSITGVHPGPRMLLVVAPVLAATLAGELVARRRTIAWVLPLLLISAAWSMRSLELLSAKRQQSGALAAALRSRPEDVVATQLFWLPTEMAALWPEKRFFLVGTTDDVRDLAGRLAAAGETGMLTAALPGTIPGAAAVRVRHPRFPEHSVDLHVLSLGGGPPSSGTSP